MECRKSREVGAINGVSESQIEAMRGFLADKIRLQYKPLWFW